MPSVASLALENGYRYHTLLVPLLFTLFSTITNINQPVQHSLLIAAASWAIIWLPAAFKAGIWSSAGTKRRRFSVLAGACFAFAHICDRVAIDKTGTRVLKVCGMNCHETICSLPPEFTSSPRCPRLERHLAQVRFAAHSRYPRRCRERG
jgi:hypothetical protein